MNLLQIFEATVSLSFIILFHEFGHFLAAKVFGVGVEEFGFGYPPRVWGKKIGGTLYSLNFIPFGGFCKLSHEEFSSKPKWRRALIILSGVLANFVLGWFFLSFLFAVGNPVFKGEVVVLKVCPGSPAEGAGVAVGDVVLSVSGVRVETAEGLVAETRKHLGEEVVLEIDNGGSGERKVVKIVPRENPPAGEGPLGVEIGLSGTESFEKTSVWAAPIRGFSESVKILGETILGVGGMLKRLVFEFQPPRELAGPVGVYGMTMMVSKLGFRYLLQFAAFLSLNLSLLNFFPIPALDGGQLLFVIAEAVRRKRVRPETEQLINGIGVAFLALLAILLTVQDIKR